MPTKRSTFDVEFKALSNGAGDTGQFEALVSIYGNVDHGGDRVVKGAFEDSIAELRAKGDPLPILWSHEWGNPNAHIGFANPDDIEETDKGLKVKGQLDVEDNLFARQVFKLLKERRVKEFSFSYDIRKERRAKDGANELVSLGLIEAGPTLKGMNPDTELLSVKSDLEAAAAKCNFSRLHHTTEPTPAASDGAKAYGTVEGSMEEAQRQLSDAVKDEFGAEDVWTWIVATYADRIVYSRESQDGPTEYFEVSYEVDEDTVTFGESASVELSTEVRAKAGRRISQATESELRTRITTLRAEIDAIESLLPQEESDSEKTAESEASPGNESDDLLKFKTAIAAAMSN